MASTLTRSTTAYGPKYDKLYAVDEKVIDTIPTNPLAFETISVSVPPGGWYAQTLDQLTYTQQLAALQALPTTYPTNVVYDDIGNSTNGKEMGAVRIFDNLDNGTRPIIGISFGIHGVREMANTQSILDFITLFLTADDPVFNLARDKFSLYVVMVNPDGMDVSFNAVPASQPGNGGGVGPSTQPTINNRNNGNDVNLNRNWPHYFDWSLDADKGASAASEAEVSNIQTWLNTSDRVDRVIAWIDSHGWDSRSDWGFLTEQQYTGSMTDATDGVRAQRAQRACYLYAKHLLDKFQTDHGTRYTQVNSPVRLVEFRSKMKPYIYTWIQSQARPDCWGGIFEYPIDETHFSLESGPVGWGFGLVNAVSLQMWKGMTAGALTTLQAEQNGTYVAPAYNVPLNLNSHIKQKHSDATLNRPTFMTLTGLDRTVNALVDPLEGADLTSDIEIERPVDSAWANERGRTGYTTLDNNNADQDAFFIVSGRQAAGYVATGHRFRFRKSDATPVNAIDSLPVLSGINGIQFPAMANDTQYLYFSGGFGNDKILYFESGGTYEVVATDVVTGALSGVTATVVAVSLFSGTWAGGDAKGHFSLSGASGTFTLVETLNVGANINVATVTTGGTEAAHTEYRSQIYRIDGQQAAENPGTEQWDEPAWAMMVDPIQRHTLEHDSANARLVIAGGRDDSGYRDDIRTIVIASKAESFFASSLQDRGYHTSCISGGFLYLFGGFDGANTLDDVRKVNLTTGAVDTTPANLPGNRRQQCLVQNGTDAYLIAGEEDASGNDIRSNIWKYDMSADTVTALTPELDGDFNDHGEFETIPEPRILSPAGYYDSEANCVVFGVGEVGLPAVHFTSGGTYEVVATDVIVGDTSGEQATVSSVVLTSGSWAAGTAAGHLFVTNETGTFSAEDISVGANSNVATLDGPSRDTLTATPTFTDRLYEYDIDSNTLYLRGTNNARWGYMRSNQVFTDGGDDDRGGTFTIADDDQYVLLLVVKNAFTRTEARAPYVRATVITDDVPGGSINRIIRQGYTIPPDGEYHTYAIPFEMETADNQEFRIYSRLYGDTTKVTIGALQVLKSAFAGAVVPDDAGPTTPDPANTVAKAADVFTDTFDTKVNARATNTTTAAGVFSPVWGGQMNINVPVLTFTFETGSLLTKLILRWTATENFTTDDQVTPTLFAQEPEGQFDLEWTYDGTSSSETLFSDETTDIELNHARLVRTNRRDPCSWKLVGGGGTLTFHLDFAGLGYSKSFSGGVVTGYTANGTGVTYLDSTVTTTTSNNVPVNPFTTHWVLPAGEDYKAS